MHYHVGVRSVDGPVDITTVLEIHVLATVETVYLKALGIFGFVVDGTRVLLLYVPPNIQSQRCTFSYLYVGGIAQDYVAFDI